MIERDDILVKGFRLRQARFVGLMLNLIVLLFLFPFGVMKSVAFDIGAAIFMTIEIGIITFKYREWEQKNKPYLESMDFDVK